MILFLNDNIDNSFELGNYKTKKRMPLRAFLNFQLMIGYIRDV